MMIFFIQHKIWNFYVNLKYIIIRFMDLFLGITRREGDVLFNIELKFCIIGRNEPVTRHVHLLYLNDIVD